MDKKFVQTNRRDFLKYTAALGGTIAAMNTLRNPLFAEATSTNKYINIIDLPYAANALQPHLSEATVNRHYTKHHQSYYRRLTKYIEVNPKFNITSLDDLIKKTKGGILLEDSLFNIAVLLWNHNFYWQCMKPKGGIQVDNKSMLTKQIVTSFGSIEKFKEKFIQRCNEIGIGWVWLIKVPGGLEIIRTDYHDNLIPSNYPPMFTIDVWEHAYYMDYGNDRRKYVENYLNHLVNWDFAEANFKAPVIRVGEKQAKDNTKKKPKKKK